MLLQTERGVNELALPRKRKALTRYEVGSSVGHHPGTPKEYFRQHYFECLDTVVSWHSRQVQPTRVQSAEKY